MSDYSNPSNSLASTGQCCLSECYMAAEVPKQATFGTSHIGRSISSRAMDRPNLPTPNIQLSLQVRFSKLIPKRLIAGTSLLTSRTNYVLCYASGGCWPLLVTRKENSRFMRVSEWAQPPTPTKICWFPSYFGGLLLHKIQPLGSRFEPFPYHFTFDMLSNSVRGPRSSR